MFPVLVRPLIARQGIVDFVRGLINGEVGSWVAVGLIAACIVFFIVYEKVTGKPFVKSRKERREARRRRKHVLWEYRRDD